MLGVLSGPGVTGTPGAWYFNPATAGVGTHTLTYNFLDTHCTNTTTINVTVYDLPTVNIGSVNPMCVNASQILLSGSPSGGTFSGPGVLGNNFNPATAGVGTHTITYNYTDANSCGNSATTNITVYDAPAEYPDIRIQICPNLTQINLSSYLDATRFVSVTWSIISAPAGSITVGGILNSSNFVYPNTYAYKYNIVNECHTSEGKLYAKTTNANMKKSPRDYIVICYENAKALNLNNIFGIEAGGTISTATLVENNYITRYGALSNFNGAVIFDGYSAYSGLSGTYAYSGPYTIDAGAKIVKFTYTSPPQSCLASQSYDVYIILTNETTSF
jgi:hypothetical protein